MPNTGQVGILNVGAGDTKLTFDPNNPAEMIRAARIVKDMIRRGYALLVETKIEGQPSVYRRAYDFDEATCEYIIADLDPVAAQRADDEENEPAPAPNAVQAEDKTGAPTAETPRPRRGRPPTKRVHASTTRTVAVARTAGG